MIKKRQAICITPQQLIDYALKLMSDEDVKPNTKCVCVIINKHDCSDTWEFEK